MNVLVEKLKEVVQEAELVVSKNVQLRKDLDSEKEDLSNRSKMLDEYNANLESREGLISKIEDLDKEEAKLQEFKIELNKKEELLSVKLNNNELAYKSKWAEVEDAQVRLQTAKDELESERSKFEDEKSNWKQKLIEEVDKMRG